MRFSALFTLACAITAFILSILCLFAGHNRSFLQDADIMTLNISRIGHTELFDTDDGDGGLFDDLVNSLQQDINDLLNDVSSNIAGALNLPGFYRVHAMNFCEGDYSNITDPGSSMNTTNCTGFSTMFSFEPSRIVADALPSGVTLEDIHWPDQITDAEDTIRAATHAMVICYIIGIAFTGVAMFTAIWAVVSEGRLPALANFGIDILAFLSLAIASSIATAVAVIATNAINEYGNDIGIEASRGGTFLGMTWSATALMLLAAVLSIVQCIAGRKRSRRTGEKSRI